MRELTPAPVGRHTSIAIGADGRGIISYQDVTNGRLKVAHCNDTAPARPYCSRERRKGPEPP